MSNDKFQNKYRIASARAQWWDYGWNGSYFITICTKNREHFFGEINVGKMQLSHLGVIADILWHEIPNHAKYVELGDFVVMPNHIHGILILDKPDVVTKTENKMNPETIGNGDDGNSGGVGVDGNAIVDAVPVAVAVETLHATSLRDRGRQQPPPQSTKNEQMASISPKSDTISTIIRSYKSAVTKHANRLGLINGWQPRFHDHIIRSNAEYQRISDYIINNPVNWDSDKFNSDK